MTTDLKTTPRFLAVDLLTRVAKQGTYSNIALNQVIKNNHMEVRDAHLLTQLVYGVIQRRLTLEYWLAPFVKNPSKMDNWVQELLLSAIYQMHYLDKIPTRAIFNESIEIAKRKGHAGTRKFVTGVLHAIEREGIRPVSEIKDDIERLSIESSTPVWLVNELIKQVGLEKTTYLLASINEAPDQSVRVNTAKATVEEVIEKMENEGFEVKRSQVSPVGLLVTNGFAPDSGVYHDGLITIQDESAMLVADAMNIQPGAKVLDACAAPGGKTTHIASFLDETLFGEVVGLDIHAHKVKLIGDNAKRLGLSSVVEEMVLDARLISEEFDNEYFDSILVDAPCSGIGLLRRKPEIKYEKTLADSKNLQKIQLAILDKVAPTLKKGGRLTYSTCTILDIENKDVVNQFVETHSEFKVIETPTALALKENRDDKELTIYPDDYHSDGFFITCLEKQL